MAPTFGTSVRLLLLAGFLGTLVFALGGCSGTSTSHTSCNQSSDCQPGNYCSSGTCKPKVSLGPCADGTGHAANDVCANGICLGGGCCVAKCTQGDPGCGAVSCDPTMGACLFVGDGGPCGQEDCTNGLYTPLSTCDGTGKCNPITPTSCQSGQCTGTKCTPACAQTSDCDGGYCADKVCTPTKPTGVPCASTMTSAAGEACASGVCLTRCCAAPCPNGNLACAATACDTSGVCVYPGATTTCGAPHCVTIDGGVSIVSVPAPICDAGNCQALPQVDCAPYSCDTTATDPTVGRCYVACNLAGTTCAPSGFCLDGGCATKADAGGGCGDTSTSTGNQACQSNICSGGSCCLQSCPENPVTHCVGPCDDTGACVTQTCPSGFGCLPSSPNCAAGCMDDSTCDTAHFCVHSGFGNGSCCQRYVAGDTIAIDSVNGNDFNDCCGDSQHPCGTLTKAMSLVAAAKVSGVVLNAVKPTPIPDWTGFEHWPVHLGWGVTLNAAGIYFTMPVPMAGNSTLNHFEVYSYGAGDTAAVTIKGGAADPKYANAVHIGFDPGYATGGAINAVIDPPAGKTAVPLTLSSVWLDTSPTGVVGAGLAVGPAATVTLGPSSVLLGNPTGATGPLSGVEMSGLYGLLCQGAGAKVSDDPAATSSVVLSANTTAADLEAESGCQVTLTQGPFIGMPLVSATCDSTQVAEYDGIRVTGGSTVTFGSKTLPGTIQCCRANGVDLSISDATGSPTVTFDHVSVVGASCAAVYVPEGTFSAKASSFTQNQIGVWATANAIKVDLSGGETITCNGSPSIALAACSSKLPPSGVDLLNSTAKLAVNAQGTTWDNWSSTDNSTQLWACSDTTYSSCVCAGPNCPGGGATSLPDDADAVYLTTNGAATPIDSTKGFSAGGTCK